MIPNEKIRFLDDDELEAYVTRTRFDVGSDNRFPSAIAVPSAEVDEQRTDYKLMMEYASESIRMHKIALSIFLLGMFGGIHLPSLIIAGSNHDETREVFRSLAVVAALFLNFFISFHIWGVVGKDKSSEYSDAHDTVNGRSHSPVGRMETAFLVGFVCMILETSLLSLGSNQGHLIAFGIAALVIRFVMLVINGHAIHHLNHMGCNSEYLAYTHVLDGGEFQSSVTASGEELSQWNTAFRLRQLMAGSFQRGFVYIIGMLIVLFLITGTHFTYEFYTIFSHQLPIIPSGTTKEQRRFEKTASYMPQRLHNQYKVHLVVVDGLRYDHTEDGASALGDFFHSAPLRNSTLRYKARAQLPSFSVPNWLTILTGALPETHGVTGNVAIPETDFDTIFQQARNYGVHTGMTGTPWWRDLVFTTLPTLDGDGTVPWDAKAEGTPEYGWTSSNPADELRLATALKAIRRSNLSEPFGSDGVPQLYDFFLTHFSDVDIQGHEYGISVQWNTRNTYMRAIENKTYAIRDIINQIDDDTILIVTSDHGHVMRGGHGGVSDELRDVPIIFYNKRGIFDANKRHDNTTTRFSNDDVPRKRYGNSDYHNTDLCATITALLGIPSPRQSIGIFIEDVLHQALGTNDTIMEMLYYDLFIAKLAAVQGYADTFTDSGILSDIGDQEVLRDPVLDVVAGTVSGSTSLHVTFTKRLIDSFWSMRNDRKAFVEDRNIAMSVLTGLPAVAMIVYTFTMHGPVNLHALVKRRNPSTHLNSSTFIAAFITVLGFLTVSIVAFVIWYAGDGYSLWDSTLTHTTSVASDFLTRAILLPIICFVIFTKGFLAHTIIWRTGETWAMLSSRRDANGERVRITPADSLKLAAAFLRDVWTVVFATSRYHPHLFPRALLYLTYLAFWTAITTLILLICQCPYTFLFPIVFSTQHVSEANLEYRFRIITVLMMITPLQIGTALLLFVLPRANKQEELCAWDHVYVTAYLHNDLQVVFEAEERPKSERQQRLKQQSIVNISREYRTDLVCACIMLLMKPLLRVVPDLLHVADLSGVTASPVTERAADKEYEEVPAGRSGGGGADRGATAAPGGSGKRHQPREVVIATRQQERLKLARAHYRNSYHAADGAEDEDDIELQQKQMEEERRRDEERRRRRREELEQKRQEQLRQQQAIEAQERENELRRMRERAQLERELKLQREAAEEQQQQRRRAGVTIQDSSGTWGHDEPGSSGRPRRGGHRKPKIDRDEAPDEV